MTRLRVRIVGTALPGLRHDGREHVHVGVQRGREVVDAVPGDSGSAVFDLHLDLVATPEGTDFRGPYVHGGRGARFLYLSWGDLPPGGSFAMFRRAKLLLSAWDRSQVTRATADGWGMEGRLALRDRAGAPLCASVRPPAVTWRAVPMAPAAAAVISREAGPGSRSRQGGVGSP